MEGAERARLTVVDMLGRVVAEVEGASWSGELAAGVYLVRAEAGGEAAVGRVTVVR